MDLSILTITQLKRLISAAKRRIYVLEKREAWAAARKALRAREQEFWYVDKPRKKNQHLTLAERQAIQAANAATLDKK